MTDVVEMLRVATRMAQKGDNERAAEKFLEVVATAEEDPRGWFGAGICLARTGNQKDAREALEHAAILGHPRAREALEKVGHLAARKAAAPSARPQAAPTAPRQQAPAGAAKPPASAVVPQMKAAKPAEAKAAAPPVPKIDLGKRVRIMLIEDKPRDRQAIDEALQAGIENVEIVHSPFAESASRTIVGLGIFDVAIMDWNTSPRAAKELLDFLKLKQPHIPVIVLTQAWSEEMATDAIRAGADYCLVKASGYVRILPSVIEQRFKQNFALQEKLVSEMEDPAHGWRKYFENVPHPVLLLDRDGIVLDVNLATVAVLHEARDRLAGRHCEKLFTRPPGAEFFFPLNEAFATGEPVTVERGEPKLGTRFRVTVYRSADEDEVQYVCTLHDLSREQGVGTVPGIFFASALNQSGQQIFLAASNGKFLYANGPFAESLGCKAEDLIGRTEAEVRPGPDAERRMEDVRRVAKQAEAETIEENRNGRWLTCRLTPVRDEDCVAAVLGMGHDVTDRRRREGQAGATLLGKLADLAEDMAFELDAEGTVTFVNASAGRVCGREPSEVVGRPFGDVVGEGNRKRWRDLLARVMQSGSNVAREEMAIKRPDGATLYGELSLTPSADAATGKVNGARGILRDGSARKRLEAAIGLLKGEVPLP